MGADGFDAGSIFVTLKAQLDEFNAGIGQAKKTLDSLGEGGAVAFEELNTGTVVFQEIEAVATKTSQAFDQMSSRAERLGLGVSQAAKFFQQLNTENTRLSLNIKETGDNLSITAKQTEQVETRANTGAAALGRYTNRIIGVQLALITLSQQAGPFRDLFQGISNGVATASAAMQLFQGKVSLLGGGLIGLGVAIESFIFRAWEDAIKAQNEGTDQMESSRKRVDELRIALEDAANLAKVFGSTYADDLAGKLRQTESTFSSNLKRLREISAELLKLNGADPGIFGTDRTAKIESLNTERDNLAKQQETIRQTGLFDKQFADVQRIKQATKDFNHELENTEIVGKTALDFGLAQPAEVAAKSLSDARAQFDRLILDNAKIIDDSNKYGLSKDDRDKILAKAHSSAEIQTAAEKAAAAKRYDDAVKATTDLAKTFSTSVGDGLRDAILNAKKPMEALAGIGQNLFGNMIDQTVKRLETGLESAFTSITGAAGEGIGLAITGILGAAGAVLSKLGSKGSDAFNPVQSAVTSTQAVRGIVAGPANVAVASVGDNLARAVAPLATRMDTMIGYLASIDRKTGVGGRGGAPTNVAFSTP